MAPRLVGRKAGEVVATLELRGESGRWVVGRSVESDLCIDDHTSLSRKHVAITLAEDGCYYVTDLGSVHGTRYAGQPLAPNQPMRLFDGVSFTLGQSEREYSTEGVPLVPLVRQTPAPAAGAPRAVRGPQPRPASEPDHDGGGVSATGTRAPEPPADDDAELQEMFGLPSAFGKRTAGPEKSLDEKHGAFRRTRAADGGAAEAAGGGKAARAQRRGKQGATRIQLAARVGDGLGVAADAPAADVRVADAEDDAAEGAAEAAAQNGAAHARLMLPPPPRAAPANGSTRSPSLLTAQTEPSGGRRMSSPGGGGSSGGGGGSGAGGSGAGSSLADGEEAEEDEDVVGPPLPPGFAAAQPGAAGVGEAEDDEEDLVGPPMPPGFAAGGGAGAGGAGASDDDDADDDDDDAADADEEEDGLDRHRQRLPISHLVSIRGHSKSVTVVSLDQPGARMVTGSSDYGMRMYDFNGMSSDLRPFRQFEEPLGSYQLRSIDWSPTASNFVVGASSPQARLYDRDGKELCTLMRGDMYLRDLRNTRGHVAALTCVRWHPTEPLTIATASEDSTLRTWDVEVASKRDDKRSLNPTSGQLRAFPVRDDRGQRTAVTAFDWHQDGRVVVLSAADGTAQLWDVRHHDTRAQLVARGAHEQGCGAACVKWAPASAGSAAGNIFASRGGVGDGTLKLWDVRMLRASADASALAGGRMAAAEPLAAWGDLPTLFSTAPCVWSPSGEFVCTGTSIERAARGAAPGAGSDAAEAHIVACSARALDAPPMREPLGASASVAGLAWHPRLNQIFVGGSDGVTYALYDPAMSERGVLLCNVRAPKRRQVEMGDAAALEAANAIAPHALPLFREGPQRSRKRGREREREREIATKKPLQPPPGVGIGGRVTEGFQHALIKTVDRNLNAFRDEDPREAILKYAELAEKDPLWTNAYAKTQPKTILAKTVDPADDEKDLLPE